MFSGSGSKHQVSEDVWEPCSGLERDKLKILAMTTVEQ